MAKQLKDYKRKEIGCLIVEDFETGMVFKVIGEENIFGSIHKYSDNEITYVYTPTPEQRKEILGMFETTQNGENVVSTVSNNNIIVKMIPMLTDIIIDLDSEEDLEMIQENINDPDRVFGKVLIEINNILLDINLEYMENLKTLGKVPMELFEAILSQQELLGVQDVTV